MQPPDTAATRITERLMQALVKADVLKPDEPNHPMHYNRTFTTIYELLDQIGVTTMDGRRIGTTPIHFDKAIEHSNPVKDQFRRVLGGDFLPRK